MSLKIDINIDELLNMFENGEMQQDIYKIFGVSHTVVCRKIKELKKIGVLEGEKGKFKVNRELLKNLPEKQEEEKDRKIIIKSSGYTNKNTSIATKETKTDKKLIKAEDEPKPALTINLLESINESIVDNK